ncbi:unnamed protein product, partial [Dracunculus medinensis]|uniref:PDZ domain-containing protein n=1 Tax=Dracunculus medinensis TaxID=318479 RepID=A0A158Q4Z8_DRAME
STETWQVDRQRIDPDSAASLQRLNDDPEDEDRFFYTKDKIKRKYGDMDGNAILLKLEKVPRGGLGLSLAASRERDRPTVVVVAVRSTCPLPVEVNGQVLLGLSHLNASTRIRECSESGYLSLILLRRFRALVRFVENLPSCYFIFFFLLLSN